MVNFFGGSKKVEREVVHDDDDRVTAQAPVSAPVQMSAPVIHTPQAPREEPRPRYGIQDAIQLMRNVPMDTNVELVVAVIKTTLESLRVRVPDIIEDATRRQNDIEARAADLKQQIAEFEREIATRKDEIGRLEADHAETSLVKERLELAEASARGSQAPAAQPAQRSRRQPAASQPGIYGMEPARVVVQQAKPGDE